MNSAAQPRRLSSNSKGAWPTFANCLGAIGQELGARPWNGAVKP
jgi:hypothetical protein